MVKSERPANWRVYYKTMHDSYTQNKNNAEQALKDLAIAKDEYRDKVIENKDKYKEEFNIDIEKNKEFVENTYINGSLYAIAKKLMYNKHNEFKLVDYVYYLFRYAEILQEINATNKDLEFYNKVLAIKVSQYNKILKLFYTKVQEALILEGKAYRFENNVGFICINRCKLNNPKPTIDWVATKKKREELVKQGVKLYNKVEAEFCNKNGIEYKAQIGRVFRHPEYCYEIPLLHSKLDNGRLYKFECSDYRGLSVRGKTNKDLLEECQYDTHKIMELDVDMRTKLNLCVEADKLLYTKFIRNENQEPSTARKIDSKN